MKKKQFNINKINRLLLFIILLFQINVFAQSNYPLSRLIECIRGGKYSEKVIYNVPDGKNFQQVMKLQGPNQNLLTQIIDSIYDWQWDLL